MSLHARCHAGLQRPGKPTDNAFIESLNGKFWAECLTRIIHRGAFGLRDTERRDDEAPDEDDQSKPSTAWHQEPDDGEHP